MTLTNASDCTYVNLESTLIDDFVLDQTNKTLTLIYSTTSGSDELELEIGDITAGSPNYYQITPTDLGQTSTISDQVYKFQIKLEETGQDDLYDTGCTLMDCSLHCDITEFQYANQTSFAIIYYTVLSQGLNNCTECTCDDALLLWEDLQDILNGTTSCNCG